MNTSIIYMLIDPVSDEVKYIGKTKRTLAKRLENHLYELKYNTKKVNWIKSLKSKNLIPFIFELDRVPNEDVNFWEIHYISLFRSWGIELLNGTPGGDGLPLGYKHSAETKRKIGLASIRTRAGKQATDTARLNMSIAHKGKKHSEEFKTHISNCNKLRKLKGEYKPLSNEHKLKLSNSLKGRKVHNKGKPMSTEQKLKLKMANLGKRWFNDGTNNYLIHPENSAMLIKGRIKKYGPKEKSSRPPR
jgi:hypothetical protein